MRAKLFKGMVVCLVFVAFSSGCELFTPLIKLKDSSKYSQIPHQALTTLITLAALSQTEANALAWGVLDAPLSNILLHFKTDAELTLAAYDAAMTAAKYGVVALAQQGTRHAHLAGFKQVSWEEAEAFYRKAMETIENLEQGILVLPLDAVWRLTEYAIGLSLEELHPLLLALAVADEEGKFEQVYAELYPQRVEKLERYFLEAHPDYRLFVYLGEAKLAEERAQIKEHIRALAKEYKTRFMRAGVVMNAQIVPPIGGAVSPEAILVELITGFLVSYLCDLVRPDPTLILQAMIVDMEKVIIDIKSMLGELIVRLKFSELEDWLVNEIVSKQKSAMSWSGEDWRSKLRHIRIRDSEGEGIAALCGLMYSYYQVWREIVYCDLQKFSPYLERLRQIVHFLVEADSPEFMAPDWTFQGAIFDTTDPTKPIHLLLKRPDLKAGPIRIGKTKYPVMQLAVVRYHPETINEEQVDDTVRWMGVGIQLAHEWVVKKTDSLNIGIVAVVMEVAPDPAVVEKIVQDIAWRYYRLRQYERKEALVYLIWKKGEKTRYVDIVQYVDPTHRVLPEYEQELISSLTPWYDEEVEKANLVSIGLIVVSGLVGWPDNIIHCF